VEYFISYDMNKAPNVGNALVVAGGILLRPSRKLGTLCALQLSVEEGIIIRVHEQTVSHSFYMVQYVLRFQNTKLFSYVSYITEF
jgi:hypothetical protein